MQRLNLWVFLCIGGCIAHPVVGYSSDAKAPSQKEKADQKLATETKAILKRHCYDCHGDGGSDEGGFNYALNLPRLVVTRKVVPGDVDASPLLQRILKGEMPPEDTGTKLSDEERELLERWITSGAPVDTPKDERPFVTRETVLKLIAKDLKSAEQRDRRFWRYLTITHLYNAGLSEGELDTVRLAMSKLLNSLSWERELIHPKAIDDEKTVFRFDLRSVRWSRDTWEQLLDASLFAFESPNEWLTECSQLSDCRRPMIRGDWFVADASRPPLYHTLLDMPKTLDGLETQLRINFQRNIDQDRAARAGFTQSGVSANPRVIERHRTSDGYCWVSHDFASSLGQANFFRHPLDFQADGGEVIFSLPNGLQAYLIVNKSGQRIDEAPTSIVQDPEQPGAAVVNGLSCMRCHAAGIIPKQDEVRRSVLANEGSFANQLETVKALYPAENAFQKLVDADRERFQKASNQLGVSRFSAKGEPVSNTARRFREALDLRQASAELGLTPEQFTKLLQENDSLKPHLGMLRVPGGTIKRDAFTEAYRLVTGDAESFSSSYAKTLPVTGIGPAIAGNVPAPEKDPFEIKLREAYSEVCTGGSGRFLIVSQPNAKKLLVFDVAIRKIVKEIPVPSPVRFAAGHEHLMIVKPTQRLVERWSLETLEREKVGVVPNDRPVEKVLMGSNSQGPLLMWSNGPGILWDVKEMKPLKVEGQVIGGENRWGFQLRVSADGQWFTSWHNNIGPTAFGVMQLKEGYVRTTKFSGGSHNGRWAMPSADGQRFFTFISKPELFNRDFELIQGEWPANTVLLPCVDPRFFLALNGRDQTQVSVISASDQQVLHTVRGRESLMSSSLPGRWGNHLGEPRVSFVPWLNALVTLPEDNQRIQVRHFNLEATLDKKDNYLFVLSFPPTRALAGKEFRYQIDARSKRGGLQYELAVGPDGMTVSNAGEVRWKVDEADFGIQADVIVQIRDAANQERLHAFQIEVK